MRSAKINSFSFSEVKGYSFVINEKTEDSTTKMAFYPRNGKDLLRRAKKFAVNVPPKLVYLADFNPWVAKLPRYYYRPKLLILRCHDDATQKSSQAGTYRYIHNNWFRTLRNLSLMIDAFTQIHGRRPKTFLEIGCGYGVFTSIMQSWGLEASGMDIEPSYIKYAKKNMQGTYFEGDALTFKDYGSYDLLYFYQPFYSCDLLTQFNERVAEQCKGLLHPCHDLTGPLSKGDVNSITAKISIFNGRTKKYLDRDRLRMLPCRTRKLPAFMEFSKECAQVDEPLYL